MIGLKPIIGAEMGDRGMMMGEKKKPHSRSCVNCRWCWYDEASFGEAPYNGHAGWVCDGRKNSGVANLKQFPFITQQACFQKREEWGE